jgi:hypothetical protein
MCFSDTIKEGAMRKIVPLFILLLLVLFGVAAADARGGRGDDCPAGSTDPDCK